MTADAREWQHKAFHYLSSKEHQKSFAELREAFNDSIHGLKIGIVMFIPKSELYTKDGKLSAKVHDLSNIEKSIVDVMLLKKYGAQESPYGVQNMLTDDKYLVQLSSRKVASNDWGLRISITIVAK
jgi:Holliday junction resolvase RusA-like endonuclease